MVKWSPETSPNKNQAAPVTTILSYFFSSSYKPCLTMAEKTPKSPFSCCFNEQQRQATRARPLCPFSPSPSLLRLAQNCFLLLHFFWRNLTGTQPKLFHFLPHNTTSLITRPRPLFSLLRQELRRGDQSSDEPDPFPFFPFRFSVSFAGYW